MQHTQKYQLNLIDPSDEFSPTPLNQNMETVETQLAAVDDKFTAADAALDAKFTAAIGSGGKTCRIATGTYEGTGEYGSSHPCKLTFDFKPCLVIVENDSYFHLLPRACARSIDNGGDHSYVTWEENSVSWYSTGNAANQCNNKSWTYNYVAIGESLE